MPFRRPLRTAAFLLVALSLQAYVIPLRANAEIRAITCCAARCHHPRSAAGATRCCGVEQDASDTATLSSSNGVNASATYAPLPSSAATGVVYIAIAAPAFSPRCLPRAAPLFLLTRALRL